MHCTCIQVFLYYDVILFIYSLHCLCHLISNIIFLFFCYCSLYQCSLILNLYVSALGSGLMQLFKIWKRSKIAKKRRFEFSLSLSPPSLFVSNSCQKLNSSIGSCFYCFYDVHFVHLRVLQVVTSCENLELKILKFINKH